MSISQLPPVTTLAQRGATALALVQPPTIPGAAIARALAVAAVLGAVVAAWFGVVRPEIRDAAADQVDERLEDFDAAVDEIAAGSEDAGAPVTTVVDPDGSRPTVEEGEPSFFRLSVSPPALETADTAYTVEDGTLFDLTDLRIENSNGDAGRASLSVNGEEAFVWSLENVRGSYFEPNITQLRLEPGDNLTFSVRCDVVGDPALATCFDAVNIGGRTIEIDEI